ncbi:hypothetical protein M0R45_027316 [Rubus argutus]|uniref:NAC domain-containing protein n=1 Tax=Rubus argutus TaxID=59490 RepID=A0AAW1X031_RUBAR
MASSSSSSSGCSGFMSLEELEWGVVKTFKPTDAQLVGHYLYNKMMMVPGGNGKQKHIFPELDIYGAAGMVPWDIWNSYKPIKLAHQEFLYFFSRVKTLGNNGKGKRSSRRVGCGGTWSETEPVKLVYVDGIQEPFGKMRKFRYENKDKAFEHNAAWMMDEFSIDHSSVKSSNLVLCRLKMNDNYNKRKRKFVEDEDENARRTKPFKTEEQVTSHSHEQQQLPEFDPREVFDIDDLLYSDSVDEQIDKEQGNTCAQQHQIPSHHFDNNYNCATDDLIMPVYETQHLQLEGSTDPIYFASEAIGRWDTLAPALSEQHGWSSSSTSQLQPNPTFEEDTYTVQSLPHIGSEWHQPIDKNGLVISEAQGSFGIAMQQQLPEDQAIGIAMQQHNDINDIDDIDQAISSYFNSDDFSYFNSDDFSYFNFGDQFLWGGDDIGTDVTLPQSSSFSQMLPYLGD